MEIGYRSADRWVGAFCTIVLFALIVLTAVETDWGQVILDLFGR